MFSIVSGSKIKNKSELPLKGEFPVYSSDSNNNGIVGFVDIPTYICDEENKFFVVFGDHTRTFNIANKSFSILDNVKVLKPVKEFNLKQLLFVVSSWKKEIPNLGYARHWKIAKDVKISLPTKNGEIDFDFMERFVSQLEAFRLSQLEAYLLVTGLKDYTLTTAEQQALTDFQNGKVQWGEFKVVDLFNVRNTRNILSRDIVEGSGKVPYLSASRENNAVSSYISYDEDYLDKGNCIFIGGKTFVVTYQEKDFYSNDSHNLALYLKDENQRNKHNQLFLASCIYKGLDYKYSWGNSISNRKIQSDVMQVPIKNGKQDYDYMALLISAVQKLVIKDVVLYADRKIEATKKVIEL